MQAGLLFFNGLREVDLRVARLRPSHRGAAREPRQGADVARRHRGAGARTGSRGARERRRNPADDRAGADRRRERPRRRRRDRRRRVHPRAALRRLVAQSARRPSSICSTRRWCRARSAIMSKRFQYNLLAPLFALHLNLREPPRYAASAEHPELAQAFMVIMGLDHVDQFHDIVRHHEAGTIPPTVMWGACPTVFDPSQAPPGRHTGFMWEKLPYRLNGDAANWDARARRAWPRDAGALAAARAQSRRRGDRLVHALAARCRALPAEHARGRSAGRRLHQRSDRLSPPVPRRRRLPHAHSGLYLCGSSSHPGGNITGLPGYNAAHAIRSDLGISTKEVFA